MNTNSSSGSTSFQSPSAGGNEIQNTSKPLWRYVKQCGKARNGGGGVTWECNFCHIKKTTTYTRVKSHLLREKNKGITPCEKVTPEDLADMHKLLELEKKKETAAAPKKVPLPPSAMFSGEIYTGHDSKKRKECGGSSSSLQKAFNLQGRNQLHALIARLFYASGLPFHLARSPYFVSSYSFAANNNLAGYQEGRQNISKERPKCGILEETILTVELKCLELELFSSYSEVVIIHKLQNLATKLELIRDQIKQTQVSLAQDPSSETPIQQERHILQELDKWGAVEESIWKQKSRIDWLKLGDSNTRFFHAYAKERKTSKAIKMLIRNDGTRCITQDQIKDELKQFYRGLMGSAVDSLPMVEKQIIQRGPGISNRQQINLCAQFTEKEIVEALFNMESQKASGVDGFNVFFFKRA